METQTPNPHAHRVTEILARPIWTVEDVAIVMNAAVSTVRDQIDRIPIPGAFLVGRRQHFQQQHVREWWDMLATASPFVKRRNNPRGSEEAFRRGMHG